MSVPKDLGIVGFDDMPMASWTAYNLTTVRQPVANIIGTAIDLIISIVGEPGWSASLAAFRLRGGRSGHAEAGIAFAGSVMSGRRSPIKGYFGVARVVGAVMSSAFRADNWIRWP